MQYKPIKFLLQYKSYESYVEKLLWIKDKSGSEQESADLQISLIKKRDEDYNTVSSIA